MSRKCKKQSNQDWFQACSVGDLAYVQNHVVENQHSFDSRQEYRGLTGLLHSIVNDQEVIFRFLFHLEYEDRFHMPVRIPAPTLHRSCFIQLPPNSSPCMIIMISDCPKVYRQFTGIVNVEEHVVSLMQKEQNDLEQNVLFYSIMGHKLNGGVFIKDFMHLFLKQINKTIQDGCDIFAYAIIFGYDLEFILSTIKKITDFLKHRKIYEYTDQKVIDVYKGVKRCDFKLNYSDYLDHQFKQFNKENIGITLDQRKAILQQVMEIQQLVANDY